MGGGAGDSTIQFDQQIRPDIQTFIKGELQMRGLHPPETFVCIRLRAL